jgi:uncharacterized protein with FMN-binding domain
MMKKIVIAAAAALIATGASAAYKDGTYTGVAQGRASQIEVAVTVKAGKIAGVKVTKHGDTPMLCDAAADEIIPSIVKANGFKGVEPVSGATLSSKGIINAVKAALAKAK